ncbi:hypothetical protein RHSIM_Rhsim01G0125400 [Rhododendron simsii]|uniref:Uncharacterized protein n=1 Tax=Rhododendron simsii TaxID=118357 RepID=A0A834HHV4_RHOSS|nr:hypothetical protein RHSIM_Rhsim01G0125400 [Rhododendron simsii]
MDESKQLNLNHDGVMSRYELCKTARRSSRCGSLRCTSATTGLRRRRSWRGSPTLHLQEVRLRRERVRRCGGVPVGDEEDHARDRVGARIVARPDGSRRQQRRREFTQTGCRSRCFEESVDPSLDGEVELGVEAHSAYDDGEEARESRSIDDGDEVMTGFRASFRASGRRRSTETVLNFIAGVI